MKNLTSFQQRVLTGIGLLVIVGFIGWLDNFFAMWAFLGVIYIFSFYEAMKLFKLSSPSAYFWALLLWAFAYVYPNPDDLFFLVAIIFGAAIAYLHNFDKRLILPFLYPASGIFFFLILYQDFGVKAMLWLLMSVALADTGAYITGKAIGKTKFSDTSPNKTLEGVFGGIFFATLLGTYAGLHMEQGAFSLLSYSDLYYMFTNDLKHVFIIFIITFTTAVASVFGDLFESYLKREAGVKDSGDLLPGHGGILDRIDGYLFAAPIMVISLRAFL